MRRTSKSGDRRGTIERAQHLSPQVERQGHRRRILSSADTCSSSTLFDTKLTVYQGSCSSLICVTANDDQFVCPNRRSLVLLQRSVQEIEAYIDERLKSQWSEEKKALLNEILGEIEDSKKNS